MDGGIVIPEDTTPIRIYIFHHRWSFTTARSTHCRGIQSCTIFFFDLSTDCISAPFFSACTDLTGAQYGVLLHITLSKTCNISFTLTYCPFMLLYSRVDQRRIFAWEQTPTESCSPLRDRGAAEYGNWLPGQACRTVCLGWPQEGNKTKIMLRLLGLIKMQITILSDFVVHVVVSWKHCGCM